MKLPTEFVRLPLKFDVERLAHEVAAFDESDWVPHVQGFPGNSAVPLISLNGEMNDGFNGPMQITPQLLRSPYLQQAIASFGEVFGRSRIMGLGAGCRVPEHRDINYHWYTRVRIHIPITTDPKVVFYCGDTHVHMAAGEAWIFDSWKVHHVENNWDQHRTHLVIDTSGSNNFWQMVGMSEWRCAKQIRKPASVPDQVIPYRKGNEVAILTERYNAPLVMHPGEVDALIQDIVFDMRACKNNDRNAALQFELVLQKFRCEWRRLWSQYGQSEAGWPYYDDLIKSIQLPPSKLLLASNGGLAIRVVSARVLNAALNTSLANQY